MCTLCGYTAEDESEWQDPLPIHNNNGYLDDIFSEREMKS